MRQSDLNRYESLFCVCVQIGENETVEMQNECINTKKRRETQRERERERNSKLHFVITIRMHTQL